MSLEAGQQVELHIEKPVAGGRMLARHDRQIVLVSGAVPGERVVARVQRVDKQVAFAATERVLDASPDRRAAVGAVDLACGGAAYAHVAYDRQRTMKAEVIADAFARLGRLPLAEPVTVAESPERGYRMRARLHVRGTQLGFYREGTHELCDAGATGQLGDAAVAAATRALTSLTGAGLDIASIELTENLDASERVLHVGGGSRTTFTADALDAAMAASGATGCSARGGDGSLQVAGVPVVQDPLAALTAGRAVSGTLERHAESFFQANRFLLPALVTVVLDSASPQGEVLDLYAGVGLFAVAMAATGRTGITAVEGDRTSGRDLQRNAGLFAGAVRAVTSSVEHYLSGRQRPRFSTIVVDPPRTGISREALQAIAADRAARIVYVSCDPPTMARDARRLVDASYRLSSLRAFDLFPNTPHVECVGVFEREAG